MMRYFQPYRTLIIGIALGMIVVPRVRSKVGF